MIAAIIAECLPYIIAGGAALAGILGTYFAGKRKGAASNQAKHDKAKAKRSERIDDEIHGDSSNLGWRDRLHNRNQ